MERHQSELTLSEVLRDPMIRQVLRADGITVPAYAMFLRQAVRRQQEKAVRFDIARMTHLEAGGQDRHSAAK